jgi:Co/Zn/Cd efflux system component
VAHGRDDGRQIAAGTMFGSLALLADGWHMSSHTFALGISAGAYYFARRYAHDPRFAFGTWKIRCSAVTRARSCCSASQHMGFESVAGAAPGTDSLRPSDPDRRWAWP